jgi:uncharacterized membrane protein YtjA (UPF0391 family)
LWCTVADASLQLTTAWPELDSVRPVTCHEREANMSLLKWALIMLVVSLIAALFGFTELSAASADVARALFYIFLVIFLILLVLGIIGARAARGP